MNTEVIEQNAVETPEEGQVNIAEQNELQSWEQDPRYKSWGWDKDPARSYSYLKTLEKKYTPTQQILKQYGYEDIESLKSAKTVLDTFQDLKKNIIIQEFVQTNNTSDIRVIVGGNKVLAAYQRVAGESEIRTNIHSGGTRKEYKISKEEEKLAVMSAKAIGANICGVDILNAKVPSVIEINLSPSLHSISEVAKKNVLGEVARFLYNETVKFKEKKEKKIQEKILKKNGKKDINNNLKNQHNSDTYNSSKSNF